MLQATPARPSRSTPGLAAPDPCLSFPDSHPEAWIIGSIVVGLSMASSGTLASVGAILSIFAALAAALLSRRVAVLLVATAYVGLSDVLWRATEARVPWESSKYLVIILSVATIARLVRRPRRLGAPLCLVVLVTPAAIITFIQLPVGQARDAVSFALLGVLAIAASTAMFRQYILTRPEFRGVLWWGLSPCISVGAMAAWRTATAETIVFGNESMFATAGGFGPNQVSPILGLGVLLAIGLSLTGSRGRRLVLVVATAVVLAAEALITLSRGGIYSATIAAVVMVGALMLQTGNRRRGIVVLAVGGLVALAAFTWAQGFSGGAVEHRFSQDDSGRGRIANTELNMFTENPAFGVGAGQAKLHRTEFDNAEGDKASHNEYTRLLAEHGVLGIGVMATLAIITVEAVRRGLTPANRAISLGLLVWSLAMMAHSATRVAATGLVFGLASLRWEHSIKDAE